MQNNHAFTLIEILVLMAVLVILSVVVGANYKSIFSQQELVASAQHLHQFLNLAKLQAIKDNQQIYVYFCKSSDSKAWEMAQSEQSGCDCSALQSCLLNGVEFNQELVDGHFVFVDESEMAFTAGATPNTYYTSYNTMRFSTTAGHITLTDSDNEHALRVKQSIMRAKICGEGGDQLGYPAC